MAYTLRIRELRQKLSLSQSALADRSGVPQTTISAIENGTQPKANTLAKLSQALNVSMEDLLKNDDSTLVS